MTNNSQHSHWTSFWSKGHVNTFGHGEENYSGFIEQFWRRHFAELESGSGILDVACGNGAIALLAEKIGRELDKKFAISACDVARIVPRHSGSEIDFHGGVDIAKTEFPAAQYQLITSQFGFEYSDRSAALVEINRLLVSGGRFVAFTHHDQSDLVQTAREICRFLDGPVKADKPLVLSRELVRAMGKIESRHDQARLSSNKKVMKLRKRLAGLLDRYRADYGEALTASGLLAYIEPLFKEGLFRPVKDKLDYLNNCQREMQHDLQRQHDLVKAGLSDEAVVQLRAQADQLALRWLGDEVMRSPTGAIVGRVLRLEKAG